MFEIFKLNKKKKELEEQIVQLKADVASMQVEIDNYDEKRQIVSHEYENTMRSAKAAQSVLDALNGKIHTIEEMQDYNIPYYQDSLDEPDPSACENAEAKCYNKESDNPTLPIESKVAQHYAICQKLNQVYKAKNHDYGDSFGDTYKKLGVISAVTRLSDKMNRLMSLAVSHDAQVKDEKIEDTLLDMANYAIMTLIELGYEVNE